MGLLRTALIVVVLVLAAAGCGGRQSSVDPLVPGQTGAALAEITSAPTPSGVDPLLWQKLTAELARVLEAKSVAQASLPVAQASLLADNAGKHGGLPHQVSTPPFGAGSATTLNYVVSTSVLSWEYYNQGDYDQNGEVNIADLTPIALHFGETGPFPSYSLISVIDGDANGEINLADVTPIGLNFRNRVGGYRLYQAADLSGYPAAPDQPNGPGAKLIGTFSLPSAAGATGRLSMLTQVVPTPYTQWYWVRPFDGAQDGTPSNYVSVIAPENLAPTAKIGNIAPTPTLAHIVWSGSASKDADGTVVRYEWDFDGDGVFEYDGGATATADYYYYAPGVYHAALRVTDNDFATGETQASVEVTAGAAWHDSIAVTRPDYGSSYSYPGITSPQLLEVQSRPALIYSRSLDEHFNEEYATDFMQAYVIAQDSTGQNWPAPKIIPRSADSCTVAVVDGLPAVVVLRNQEYWQNPLWQDPPAPIYQYENWIEYLRASDASGTSWPTHTMLAHWKRGTREDESAWEGTWLNGLGSFLILDGVPSVISSQVASYVNGTITDEPICIRALDPKGATWPQDFQAVATPPAGSLVALGGVAACLTAINQEDILFNKSLDAEGTGWAQPVLVDQLEKTYSRFYLLDLGGTPGAVYYDDGISALKYRRALDPAGSTWSEPVVLSTSASENFKAIVTDSRPLVLYEDRIDGQMKLIAANDEQGTRWGGSSVVPNGIDEHYPYIQNRPLASINGFPAYLYIERVNIDATHQESRLHYVSYY